MSIIQRHPDPLKSVLPDPLQSQKNLLCSFPKYNIKFEGPQCKPANGEAN